MQLSPRKYFLALIAVFSLGCAIEPHDELRELNQTSFVPCSEVRAKSLFEVIKPRFVKQKLLSEDGVVESIHLEESAFDQTIDHVDSSGKRTRKVIPYIRIRGEIFFRRGPTGEVKSMFIKSEEMPTSSVPAA